MGMRQDANQSAQDNTNAPGANGQGSLLGNQAPEGDKKPEGEKAPEGDKKPEGEKAPEGDKKPEGEKAPEGDKKPEGEKAPEGDKKPVDGAPEKYEFKTQEGITLAAETLDKFSGIAKELNLSQEKAQKLVDLATEHTKTLMAEQAKQWSATREGWVNEIKADKEIGGDKFQENLTRAQRTLMNFGSEKLFSFLNDTGFGDNGELIRMFAKIDKAIAEDKIVDGIGSGNQKSIADYLYDHK